MKAVAYLRVSTDVQSVERQDEELKQFAESKGFELVKTFDDVISGSKISVNDRKGFNAMESYLRTNIDVRNILILELSRLGRRNNEIQNIVEEYVQKGINIHIKDLNISTLKSDGGRSFESELLISMLGVMAANESRLLSSRIISGKMSRAKKNLVFGGKITGYKKSKDGKPEVDEKEAPIVRRMFELATQSLGARSISDIINKEFGKKIGGATISGILRNSFYKGERKYKDLLLPVESLVSEEVWKLANDYFNSRKKFVSGKNLHVNLVRGKINCYMCGSVMYQKVNPSARANLFECKNGECLNSINRPWLYQEIRKVVVKHAKKSKDKKVRDQLAMEILSHQARIESNIKEVNKLEERRKVAVIYAIDHYDDEIIKKNCDIAIKEAGIQISKIEKNNQRIKKEIKANEIAINSNIEHFSKDLDVFKTEISEILNKVEVGKEFVSINLFGWREHNVMKPNSAELGWRTRLEKQGKTYLSDREKKAIEYEENYYDEEQMDMMIDEMTGENEEIKKREGL